jgi:hypothetical protein
VLVLTEKIKRMKVAGCFFSEVEPNIEHASYMSPSTMANSESLGKISHLAYKIPNI